MRFIEPNIPTLRDRFAEGSDVLVSAPFYSANGLTWVQPGSEGNVEFWTRLNPHDWASGVADPPALRDFLNEIGEGRVTLRVHRVLHAKIYQVDSSWAWVGSPNLSDAAFRRNVELVAELSDEEIPPLNAVIDQLRQRLTPLTLTQLSAFIDVAADAVGKFENAPLPEDLLAAVQLADEALTPPREGLDDAKVPDLEDFISYVRSQEGENAAEVVALHEGKQNRQGHIKQAYFAISLFLFRPEHHQHAETLKSLNPDPFPVIPQSILTDWVDFLDHHANHVNEARNYSFSTLRNILPENLGGYVRGGGGGSGPLKRVFPLAARFLDA